MLRFLRLTWIASLLAFLAVLVVYYARRVDPRASALYARDIRRLSALHAEFETDVLQMRSELLRYYDPPNATLDELFRLHRTLSRAPSFLPPEARADIEAKVAASERLLVETEERFEEFKQNNAQLRNSTRYAPTAAREIIERFDGQPDGDRRAAPVKELLRDLLLYELLPEAAYRSRVEQRVDALKQLAVADTDDGRNEAEALLRHVKTILRKKPQVEDSTERIVNPIALRQAEELDATWARYHEAALDAAQSRRSLLFVLAVATLLFAAAEIITRQRRAEATLRYLTAKLKIANQDLRRERAREKELSELKTRFVSMTSHEYRTPLSVIRSSADLLQSYWDRWDAEKRARHLSRIKDAAAEMTKLLEGVLMIGRADAGTLAFDPKVLALDPFCGDVVEAVRETFAHAPQIDCVVHGEADTAALDERLMRHILTNLLSNAVKYSDRGAPIRLDVDRRSDRVVFRVEDEGIGIPEADLPHLFDSFHRGTNVAGIPGTGLGLALVKRLVDRHHGTIEVISKEGAGTTFVVSVPAGEGTS